MTQHKILEFMEILKHTDFLENRQPLIVGESQVIDWELNGGLKEGWDIGWLEEPLRDFPPEPIEVDGGGKQV